MIIFNYEDLDYLITNLPDSMSLQTVTSNYTQILIKELHKNGKNISWKQQECSFELPTIQFLLFSRGYEAILRADKPKDIINSMVIVTIMVFAPHNALREYNNYSSLDDLFNANPGVEDRYLKILAKIAP